VADIKAGKLTCLGVAQSCYASDTRNLVLDRRIETLEPIYGRGVLTWAR
jgi:hypothetical protein